MIKSFLALFEERLSQHADEQHTLELASAALMFEVVRADRTLEPAEETQVKTLLSEQFKLTEEELNILFAQGQEHAEEAVDLVQFTRVLNQHYGLEQRANFIQQLWSIAYSDGHIDMHEEHAIRRINDLLHVPHSLFVQAKLKVV
ncbi:TerB family tellurite resistance protein [Alteromonas flava]|uniref:tellurite resistance TerB family protein n=1 Tax=Alteromonas flava TaxID=2048003 RepID=UPI000C285EC8|nr:TerB family tellurite resistance protein [Alteromonas flava]